MTLNIITPEERLSQPRGVHALVLGPYGIGKTSLVKTLDPSTTLFMDSDEGDLAIHNVLVPHVRPKTWPQHRDLIVRISGPNPSFGPNEPYSQTHFDRAGGWLPGIERIRTIVFDSTTASARACFRHSSMQPEAFSSAGKSDLRSAYGLHAREFLLAMHRLHSMRERNLVLTGALETVTDDDGRTVHQLQAEGQRIGREIPGIVDLVITMNSIDFGDGKPVRAFVCTSPNPWGYPAKDRSGKLEQIEKPDLGALIAKILPPVANHQGGVAETNVITPNDGQHS
jgi:hypothetical protein